MKSKKSIILVLTSLFLLMSPYFISLYADVKLYGLFTDNMILQRNMKVPVWGIADAGERVTVEIKDDSSSKTMEKSISKTTRTSKSSSFNQTFTVTSDRNGNWKIYLKPLKAGGPVSMIVKGKNTITLKNILIGDVWICGGQSNMAWSVNRFIRFEKFKNVQDKAGNSKIRMLITDEAGSDSPLKQLNITKNYNNSWQECTPDTVASMSSAGYIFGQALQEELDIPIGLIKACMGGTAAESWTSMPVLKKDHAFQSILDNFQKKVKLYPRAMKRLEKQKAVVKERIKELRNRYKDKNEFKKALAKAKKKQKRLYTSPKEPMGPNHIKRPSALYYGTISPLQPFAIKGVIWYQGEANSHDYDQCILYRTLFPAMIKNWRDDWGQDDFPFLFVQLAAFHKKQDEPVDEYWSWLREAQTMTLSLKNTGMSLAIDVGMEKDIHPPDKITVGKRLAAAALRNVYGQDNTAPGPMYDKMEIKGNKAVISFRNVGRGLEARDVTLDTHKVSKDELKGFAVCGEDKKFIWAKADIKGDKVEVYHPDIQKPVAVRYAWQSFPICNLYNREGFPVVPFRTDNYPPAN